MRVNVYAEEITGDYELVEKHANGRVFTGIAIRLRSPEALHHTADDDDSSTVTLWCTDETRPALIALFASALEDLRWAQAKPLPAAAL